MRELNSLKCSRQTGIALLLLLALILVVVTTSLIAAVSLNKQKITVTEKSASWLGQAKQSLLAYAITQTPPGLLPCPDRDGDGVSDLGGGSCLVQVGFFPYQTLSLKESVYALNQPLWYAVEPDYTEINAGVKLNSSLNTGLLIDGSTAAVAVLIAPGEILDVQVRSSSNTAANVNQYLENENANGNDDDFTSITNATANDELLWISPGEFWNTVEQRVMLTVASALTTYFNNVGCSELPWAASGSPYDSSPNTEVGYIPYGNATAFAGAGGCPISLGLPAWAESHWDEALQYGFCGPSGSNCIQINGGSTANAVLLGPGPVLAGQSRPSASFNDYFEDDNQDGDLNFDSQTFINHTPSFNDALHVVLP